MTSRRDFLISLAAVAGVNAAWTAARALGLTEGDMTWGGPPALPAGGGRGAKVVILGAGVAGLSTAYELGKAGYDCVVLEARDRVGGRNFTVRHGTKLAMDDGTNQTCTFDDDPSLYFNAGPARIPSHHLATLGYCRELGVRMETEINHSGTARVQSDTLNGGQPIQLRQAIFDTRGHLAELFRKSVRNGGLDKTMTPTDRDQLVSALEQWGVLSVPGQTRRRRQPGPTPDAPKSVKTGDAIYGANSQSGWITPPGAGAQIGVPRQPLDMKTLMHPIVGVGASFQDNIDMQATMMQPVGGMDMIPRAFERVLGPVVKKGCVVTKLARKGKGVEISYVDPTGAARMIAADYCVCTIPLVVLNKIPNDLSPDRKAVIARAEYSNAIKVAFQAPRFWEEKDSIYGGLSFTDRDTFITWYPSGDLMAKQGILVAGYGFGDQANRFGALPLDQRFAYAKTTVEKLHPGTATGLRSPFTITWKNVPYNYGIECALSEQNPAGYDLLSQADGPFYFAGEHLSHVGAWQQGAFMSAHRTVALLDAAHRNGQPVTTARQFGHA